MQEKNKNSLTPDRLRAGRRSCSAAVRGGSGGPCGASNACCVKSHVWTARNAELALEVLASEVRT